MSTFRAAVAPNRCSGTIGSYAIQKSGRLALARGVAATSGAGPINAAISATGKNLFVLNSRSQTISSFTVDKDGSLASPNSVSGLPVGANGLAAN